MKNLKKKLHFATMYVGAMALYTCVHTTYAMEDVERIFASRKLQEIDNLINYLKPLAQRGKDISEWRNSLKPETITPELLKEEIKKFAQFSKQFHRFNVSAINAQRKTTNNPLIKDLENLIPRYFQTLTQERLFGIHCVFSDPSFDWRALDNEEPKILHQFSTFVYNQNMVNYGYWNGISDQEGFWHALLSERNFYIK